MIKKSVLFLVFVLMFGISVVYAQQGKPHNPNPQNDPDVQRGYNKHQEWYKEKQEKQEQKNEVDESTSTPNIITDPLPPGTGDYLRLDGSADAGPDQADYDAIGFVTESKVADTSCRSSCDSQLATCVSGCLYIENHAAKKLCERRCGDGWRACLRRCSD